MNCAPSEGLSGQDRFKSVISEACSRASKGLGPCTPEVARYLSEEVLELVPNADGSHVRRMCSLFEEYIYSRVLMGSGQECDPNDASDASNFAEFIRNSSSFHASKPDNQLPVTCTECNKRSARVSCKTCNDHFCLNCFSLIHVPNKRKMHETECIQQKVCDGCDIALATRKVEFSEEIILCESCFSELLVSISESEIPRISFLRKLRCCKCRGADAFILCSYCSAAFCNNCDHVSHLRGNSSEHERVWVDEEGFFWMNNESIMHPEVNFPFLYPKKSPTTAHDWLRFLDDDSNTYWFNMRTLRVSHSNPHPE